MDSTQKKGMSLILKIMNRIKKKSQQKFSFPVLNCKLITKKAKHWSFQNPKAKSLESKKRLLLFKDKLK